MKTMKQLHFSDEDFAKLSRAKEKMKEAGEAKSWEEFIIKKCLRKKK